MGLDTIAMVKKSSRITYEFEGRRMNSKQIFKQSKKRRGRSRYLLSVEILVEAMFQTVKSVFRVTEEQLEVFAADFYSRLPEYMQRALSYTLSSGVEAICHG